MSFKSNNIKNNQLDSKLLFCLWCNSLEMNNLVQKFEILNLIKNKFESCLILEPIVSSPKQNTLNNFGDTIKQVESSNESRIYRNGRSDSMVNSQISLPDLTRTEWIKIRKLKNKLGLDSTDNLNIPKDSFEKLKRIYKIDLRGKITENSLCKYFNRRETSDLLQIISFGFNSSLDFQEFDENILELNNTRGNMRNLQTAIKTISILVKRILLYYEGIIILYVLIKVVNMKAPINFPFFALSIMYQLTFPYLYLLLSNPLSIGDEILYRGENLIVNEILLGHCVFKKWNGMIKIIPNELLITEIIKNITRSNSHVCRFSFEIKYNQDMEKFRSSVLRTIKEICPISNANILLEKIDLSENILITCILKFKAKNQSRYLSSKIKSKVIEQFVRESNLLKMNLF